MKKFLRKAIALLPSSVANRLHALKHRIYWLTKGGKAHHTYFDAYKTRSEVLDVLRDWLASHPLPALKVLEFGSSGGNNLLLLREIMSMPVEYVGMDIQPDAIAFAKTKFPDDVFMVGDDLALAEQAETLGKFDVFLASGVLSYIPQQRCQDVLAHAARLADLVLVCDELSHFDAPDGDNDGLFLHPYAQMCRDAGLEIVVPPVPSKTGHRYSTFMARAVKRS
ncbi:MAG: class I SAM-dependent methyltransferase [Thiobacillus sp.]|uniref:methyltransferase n=1 Tax=Thiobacillus sp. TaxID=924 RepID=UPI00273293A2|nr:class I SAM-dependent methyltransferase [Thiobacillus sp.]MDP3584434.1 class I SAM-dependent methyltransferase [Thiobacillus sp.]